MRPRAIMPALAAKLIAVSLASAALAGPMMPAGSSPEAGLAGVWRFIAAKPAPWAKPRKLTKQDAPLLEYAVEFAANEVKGPAPLACKGAKYSSGVTYRNETFNGKVANVKDSTFAKTIDIGNTQFTTYRIYCGTVLRDLYVDKNANVVMGEGDVIYTLERPTGMDPAQYSAGYSGPSFDCTRAKTTGEQLICRDAALSKSDRKLGEAYAALERSESPRSFATFHRAQRIWFSYVMTSCGAKAPMPKTLGDRSLITDCLGPEYSERAELLSDLKAAVAGASVLEPRMRYRTRAKPPTEESDIYPWMRGGAPATAFNAFVHKTLSLRKWSTDGRELFSLGDDVGGMRLSARRVYALVRFDSRIVSMQITTRELVGSNRDTLSQHALTWDLAKGRLVSLDDVFSNKQDWKSFVIKFCQQELLKQMSERDASVLDGANIPAVVAASSHWLWGPEHATVVFLIDTIEGLPGGEFDVDIPLTALSPYLKPNAPVR